MKKTDNVPAMLTPKEAILNRNAAELLGRDAIKRLNAHGNMLAKRGVDLASDPTPGPSTENLLGYQMGTSDVQRDDRTDLLRDAENTFYGGGQAPVPTPTPTPPTRMYQYGTEDVRRRRNAVSRFTGALEPSPNTGAYYNYSRYANRGFSRPELFRIQRNLSNAYNQDLQYNRVANPNYQTTQDTGYSSDAQFGSGRSSPATVQQYALRYGRPTGNGLSTFQTPSGGSITYKPSGRILPGGAQPTVGPFSQGHSFTPDIATSKSIGEGTAPAFLNTPTSQQTPYQRSFAMGYQGDAVRQPQPSFGYQVGSALGNIAQNAASRIAGFFGGDNGTGFPSSANAQPIAPLPSPTPYATPGPSPTPTPPQEEYTGYQYGTSNVMPRRYSDYY